jgi:hypothetical protein
MQTLVIRFNLAVAVQVKSDAGPALAAALADAQVRRALAAITNPDREDEGITHVGLQRSLPA